MVQRCIKAIESNFSKGTSIFCEEALGCTGVQLEHQNIRLLSDSDIIYLAKQINQEDANYKYIDEYFNRGARKKSIWKSESEFDLMLRELGENDRRKFMNWMRELTEDLKDCVNSVNDSLIIDDNILKEKEKDYLQKQGDNDINQIEKDSAKEVYESIKTKINTLKQIAKIFETDFNFVITWHNRFESNVKKFCNDEVLIKYKNFEEPKPIGEVISTYSLNKKTSTEGFSNIYYLFYKRENKTIKPVEFIKKFVELIA